MPGVLPQRSLQPVKFGAAGTALMGGATGEVVAGVLVQPLQKQDHLALQAPCFASSFGDGSGPALEPPRRRRRVKRLDRPCVPLSFEVDPGLDCRSLPGHDPLRRAPTTQVKWFGGRRLGIPTIG